jgi:L-iditol 2-dehydrogenase
MADKIKAAYLDGARNLVISTADRPEIKSDEALVKVKSVGICGSDVMYYRTGGTKKRPITAPYILGHEVSGIVEDKGSEVKNLNIGDRVAVEPGITCGKCQYCKSGRYNLCKDVKFLATPPIDGALVGYISHKADLLYPLPDKISFDEGALIEPSSVAFYAVMKSGLKTARSSIILGAGPIGLLVFKMAKILGSFPICVVDVDDNRLSLAKKLGADFTINVRDKDIVKAVYDYGFDNGNDVVFECTGVENVISSSVFLVKKGGHLSMVGIFDGTAPIRTKEIIDREITITGTYRFSNTFPDVISLMERGMLEVRSLITHSFSLDEAAKAFDIADKRSENCVKIMVRVD